MLGHPDYHTDRTGGHSLIKVTGRVPTLRFLPRAVEQLKMLPRADTKFIFGTLERGDTIPHFDSPRVDKSNN